jgi:anti-sigma regulatory factor (Ser/Thr protein kinase)
VPVNLRFHNDFLALRKMSAWLEESGTALGITAPQRFEIDLVANEAVTNIISYGYPGGRQGDIELRLAVADDRVTLEIEDDGKAFNPLEVDARHAPEGLDDAQVGGLGIHLIRMTMPDCQYRRDADHNVFTLQAPLSHSEELAPALPKQEG